MQDGLPGHLFPDYIRKPMNPEDFPEEFDDEWEDVPEWWENEKDDFIDTYIEDSEDWWEDQEDIDDYRDK